MFTQVLLCLLALPVGAVGNDPLPARFDSEVIRIHVEEDSLRVDGLYRFVIRSSGIPAMTMLYPYPADSLLGGARTVLLECRTPGADWEPLPFQEMPGLHAARWRIPLDRGTSLEVRAVYRQELHGGYGRYIVTTTGSWGEPLRKARFEIYLPEGARPVRFSYPFRMQRTSAATFYLFEAESFLPEKDITFEWSLE